MRVENQNNINQVSRRMNAKPEKKTLRRRGKKRRKKEENKKKRKKEEKKKRRKEIACSTLHLDASMLMLPCYPKINLL